MNSVPMPIETVVNPTTALSPSRLHRLPWGLAFGLTDIGPVRSRNEDNFLIDEALELAVVADGMGGHANGALASATALTAVQQFLQHVQHADLQAAQAGSNAEEAAVPLLSPRDPDSTGSDPSSPAVALLNGAVQFANAELHTQNRADDREQGGMGTTLTGLWRCAGDAADSDDVSEAHDAHDAHATHAARAGDTALVLFHVGDSRLYRCRAGELIQLTRDQTLYQQALDMGAIENLPPRNFLLQAVGPSPDLTPEIRALKVRRGDVLMLCSDGLHGSVPHGDIEQTLAEATATTLEQSSARLIALAKEYGVRDNITVLLIWCDGGRG